MNKVMSLRRKAAAEMFGRFWLVSGGCGAAVLAGSHIGFVGAFGLTVVAMAYGIGHISGRHLNPAVTVGLAAGGRVATKEVPYYVASQVVGASRAGLALMLIVQGHSDGAASWIEAQSAGFAANGYGEHSPGGYGASSAFLVEVLLTYFFLLVTHGATDERA